MMVILLYMLIFALEKISAKSSSFLGDFVFLLFSVWTAHRYFTKSWVEGDSSVRRLCWLKNITKNRREKFCRINGVSVLRKNRGDMLDNNELVCIKFYSKNLLKSGAKLSSKFQSPP